MKLYLRGLTKARYILDLSSGPLLEPTVALSEIALGCAAYMLSSLDLADRSKYDHNVASIACGYHSMHRYASAKWLHHLHQLALLCENSGWKPQAALSSVLRSLSDRHNALTQSNKEDTSVTSADARVLAIAKIFPALRILQAIAADVWSYEDSIANGNIQGKSLRNSFESHVHG